MLDQLTIDMFRPHLGSKFKIALSDTNHIEFVLDRVDALSEKSRMPGATRDPFSMIFRGPGNVLLAQQIVPMTHEVLGKLAIFLVPIGQSEGNYRYEAIFN